MKIRDLTETPILVDINKDKMWKKVQKILEDNNITFKDFEKTSIKDIYLYDSPSTSFFIHYTEDDGITAFLFFVQDAIKYKNKVYKVIRQENTYNMKRIKKNFTLTIFKEMNKKYKRPVLIDNKNSVLMMNTFIKWMKDPKKYGIENFFVVDGNRVLEDDEYPKHPVWEEFKRAKRYSIVFDFEGYLTEAEVIPNPEMDKLQHDLIFNKKIVK